MITFPMLIHILGIHRSPCYRFHECSLSRIAFGRSPYTLLSRPCTLQPSAQNPFTTSLPINPLEPVTIMLFMLIISVAGYRAKHTLKLPASNRTTSPPAESHFISWRQAFQGRLPSSKQKSFQCRMLFRNHSHH